MAVAHTILEAIGNTPLMALGKVVPPHHARVLIKLEGANPTGSMKDRMAQAMIARAEADGRLKPGGTVVEYTGGSTGTSLALICAAKGYRLRIVYSDAFSQEKADHMRALGAEVMLVPSDGGRITKTLIQTLIETARQISQERDCYWTDQFNNTDHVAGYHALGEEIWMQTGGQVDAFVQSVGTSASLRGVGTILRQHKPGVQLIAVEPAESAVLSGEPTGAHHIEGIGAGFVPPLWDPILVHNILKVSSAEARAMAQRLAREEGLFAGISTGANVVGAIRVAEKLGRQATVVCLQVDTGLKYLSTDVFKSV
ncbi:MAG: PLP-dependent cysteine synthase family protein [Anaerolineae bacterium]|nr:PLP-dependent cysteine synthase family protein [Anaerolineae bacterium]